MNDFAQVGVEKKGTKTTATTVKSAMKHFRHKHPQSIHCTSKQTATVRHLHTSKKKHTHTTCHKLWSKSDPLHSRNHTAQRLYPVIMLFKTTAQGELTLLKHNFVKIYTQSPTHQHLTKWNVKGLCSSQSICSSILVLTLCVNGLLSSSFAQRHIYNPSLAWCHDVSLLPTTGKKVPAVLISKLPK